MLTTFFFSPGEYEKLYTNSRLTSKEAQTWVKAGPWRTTLAVHPGPIPISCLGGDVNTPALGQEQMAGGGAWRMQDPDGGREASGEGGGRASRSPQACSLLFMCCECGPASCHLDSCSWSYRDQRRKFGMALGKSTLSTRGENMLP